MTTSPAKYWARNALVALIFLYRRYLSALKPACCRFQPTCSEYGLEAIRQHGAIKGSGLLLWRLLRCQPFYRGPVYDPVPETPANRPHHHCASAPIAVATRTD